MLKYVVLLAVVITGTSGQVCMEALMSPESSISMLSNDTRLPGCLKELRYPLSSLMIVNDCNVLDAATAMMSGDMGDKKLMAGLKTAFLCVAERLGVIDTEGNVIEEKLREQATAYIGPEELRETVKSLFEKCMDETKSQSDAFLRMTMMNSCVFRASYDFCMAKGEDVGGLAFMLSMESLFYPAKCTDVDVKSKIVPLMKCAIMDKIKSMMMEGNMSGMMMQTMVKMASTDEGKMKIMDMAIKEIGKNLGMYTMEEGINFEVMKILFRSFSGWDNDLDKLEQIISDITTCEKYAVFNPDILMNATEEFSFIPLDVISYQMLKFTNCFLPKYSNTCGLKNQPALLLVPALLMQNENLITEIMKEDPEDLVNMIFQDVTSMVDMKAFGSCSSKRSRRSA